MNYFTEIPKQINQISHLVKKVLFCCVRVKITSSTEASYFRMSKLCCLCFMSLVSKLFESTHSTTW